VPVRRYNATSARTLAVYLASQDNPEQGLCHNPSAEQPVPPTKKPLKHFPSRNSTLGENGSTSGEGGLSGRRKNSDMPMSEKKPTPISKGSSAEDIAEPQTKVAKEGPVKNRRGSIVDILDEHTTIDHRSFVQNVFGTVAFKMLEWLTPRNIDILARSGDKDAMPVEEVANPSNLSQSSRPKTTSETAAKEGTEEAVSNTSLAQQPEVQDGKPADGPDVAPQRPASSKPGAAVNGETKANGFLDSKPASNPTTTPMPIPNPRKWADQSESQLSKGILNVSAPKASENHSDRRPLSRDRSISMSKRRVPRQNMVTSPKMRVAEIASLNPLHTQPIRDIGNLRLDVPEVYEDEKATSKEGFQEYHDLEQTSREPPKQTLETVQPAPVKNVALPQSLSRLSIEIIELICDILQLDNTYEDHSLHPRKIDESMKRYRNHEMVLKRNSSQLTPSAYPSSLKKMWQSFIEQALFDVLSNPDSLLQSFRNNENLFDTQTLWYLMLRMTRVAPSLVFDSLWNVTGTLFRPPEKLENAYDWAKEPLSSGIATNRAVSNFDAAQIMNICLHALVAAAPLVSDARQLANMSRIRSYGFTTLGRAQSSALEPTALCLQYDDAFTNDLALRLARRLFAAIPTRRRYAELLELQQEVRSDEKREPDILEAVLATLKYPDLGTPSILNFSDSERDLHEKRVPTLILDWARTVMLQDWEGTAEVPGDGPFGGALAMMAAICEFAQANWNA